MQHLTKHYTTQVERVVGDGLGELARFVFHHLLVVDPHLLFNGFGFKRFRKSSVGRGVDEGWDVLDDEVEGIQRHFRFHAV